MFAYMHSFIVNADFYKQRAWRGNIKGGLFWAGGGPEDAF